MSTYDEKAKYELKIWKRKLLKRSGLFHRFSKKVQTRVNDYIPDKVHHVITESIKNMVQVTLTGSNLLNKKNNNANVGKSLDDKDRLFTNKLQTYQKTAAIEGAGTGAGGIVLSLADFPLLLAIKIKMLYEIASVYGFDVTKYEERLYILHIFQLAFSSDEQKAIILAAMEDWDKHKNEINWQIFQQEYRDYIDFVKMLQLVPGIGAVVGAVANYRLIEHLGETAKYAYHMRILNK